VLLRLAAAAGLGAAVGVEREMRDREAGVRTHLLVALGAALFTVVSAYGFREFGSGNVDPTRIAAQIVTGIGFLGAGAIIREGLSVRGLTTAGSLWVVAGVGMACGAGYYWPAVVAAGLTILALWPLRIFAFRALEQVRPEEQRVLVELKHGEGVAPVLELVGDRVRHFEVRDYAGQRVATIDLSGADERLVAALSDLDAVAGVRWRR
jgi:putative Mg2+ transporter-C (MgtC) family protein